MPVQKIEVQEEVLATMENEEDCDDITKDKITIKKHIHSQSF